MRPSSWRCIDLAIGETVLATARGGRALVARTHVQHMEACDSCRYAVERTRRLAGTWRSLEPSSDEIARAIARFRLRHSRRHSTRTWAKVIVVCAVVAATGISAAAVRVFETRRAAPGGRSIADPSPLVTPSRPRATPERGGAIPSAISQSSTLHAPSLAPRPPAPSGTAAQSASRVPSLPPTPDAPTAEPVIEPTARSPWIVAAEAMRTRDYRSAERAFDELVNSPDPHTRDAARLARAEVWIAEGRVGEARSELEALRAVGATASIRNRASEAFQSLLP